MKQMILQQIQKFTFWANLEHSAIYQQLLLEDFLSMSHALAW